MGNHLEGSDLKVSAVKIKSQGLLSNNYWIVNYIENQNVLRTPPSTERNYVTYIHPPMHTYIRTYVKLFPLIVTLFPFFPLPDEFPYIV